MSDPRWGGVSDEELVSAYVDGDDDAFDALVARYERRVFAICYRYFGNASDAEDAAQDTFVAVLRRAHTFSGASRFSTWIYRVAMNACNDLARKRSRRPKIGGPDVAELADSLPDVEDLLATRELGIELASALRTLEPEHREAVVLHDVAGVPYHELAARYGVAVGTMKSRIHRGHARLAEVLRDGGGPPDDRRHGEPSRSARHPTEQP